MPLRVRLSIAFVTIVIVPLAVTAVLIQLVVARNLDTNAMRSVRNGSGAVTAVLDQLDKRAASEALAVADLPSVQQGVRDGQPTRVQRLVRQHYEAAKTVGLAPDFVVITEPTGNAIVAVGRKPEFLPNVVAPTPVQLSGGADTSPYAVLGRSILRGQDGILATVVSGFWLDAVTLRQIDPGSGIDIAIIDNDTALSSTWKGPMPLLVGIDGDEPQRVDEMFVARVAGPRNVKMLIAAPRREPGEEPIVWATVLPIALVFVILAALLGWLLARVTTKPLEALSDAAMNIASGRYDTRIVVPPSGEVGRLAIAFNAMTDEVSSNIDALERSRDELRRNLTRMGDTLSSTHDMNKMLSVILETAMVTLRAEAGAVMLYTANREELYIKVGRELADRLEPGSVRIKVGAGVAGLVGRSGEAVHGMVGERADQLRLSEGEPRARAVIAVPLKAHGRTLGVLNLYDKIGARDFDDSDVTTIRSFANQATVAIDNVLLHQESQRLSITDGLTGLWNYRYFQMTFDKEIERATRFGRPLSLLMLDLDKFKAVNDSHGHQRGDAVLIELATRIKGGIREVDTLARYGGEEFVLILPETDALGAEQAADKLCELVRQRRFGLTSEETLRLTVSIGVAVFPEHGASPVTLVRAADTALYAAKEAGRDRHRLAQRAPDSTDDPLPGQLPAIDPRSLSALESAAASVTAASSEHADADTPGSPA